MALAQARLEISQQQLIEQQQARQRACDQQILGLIFYGNSLRGSAECSRLGFSNLAPAKSTIALRFGEACPEAKILFEKYFAGKGVAGAGDEIYLSGHPALEMVEPRSLAITGIKPHTQPTQEAWKEFLDLFENLEMGISDQGRGVSTAMAEKSERSGLDIWHLCRGFASAAGRLENRAYQWIEDVDKRRDAFLAALPCEPGKNVPQALLRLEEAQARCKKAIEIYDAASTVLGWLYEAAHFIDNGGRIKTPQQMEGDWEAALDLVDHIDAPELYPLEKKLRGKIDGACVRGLAERLAAIPLPQGWHTLERERLQLLTCRAWNYHHAHRTHLLQAPVLAAAWMASEMQLPFVANHLEAYVATVFEILDRVLIASSAVECVNSVIRLREGSKRHPHPDFVYLLAWLHNTRRFTEGRRKGLTPAELLGVQLPTDGWTMLLDAIAARKAA